MLDGPRLPAANGAARRLIVLLHGVGADGHDLIDLAPYWARTFTDAAFVSFNAPEPYDQAPAGRQWFSLADRAPETLQAGAARAAPVLLDSIDAELARLGVDRVAITGFSQGAMMALYAGLRRAPSPQAIVAFSGALLAAPDPAPPVPVLLIHGEQDNVVPVERSRQAETILHAAGVPVQAMFRPGLTHAIDEVGLASAASFLQRAFAAP